MQKEALELTQKIMELWYDCNTDLLSKYLCDGTSWSGSTESQFYLGYENVCVGLKEAANSIVKCTVSEQNYVIADSGKDFCICMGKILVTLNSDKMFLSEPQKIVFVWKVIDNELKISHINVSNHAAVVAPDEEFPVKASRKNYEFIKQKILTNRVITICASNQTFYRVNINDVQYLEAANEYMLIYHKNDIIKVHSSLKKIQQEFFPEFFSIHRSYYVNPDAIRLLRPYEMVMMCGNILPISKSKYAQICEMLSSL